MRQVSAVYTVLGARAERVPVLHKRMFGPRQGRGQRSGRIQTSNGSEGHSHRVSHDDRQAHGSVLIALHLCMLRNPRNCNGVGCNNVQEGCTSACTVTTQALGPLLQALCRSTPHPLQLFVEAPLICRTMSKSPSCLLERDTKPNATAVVAGDKLSTHFGTPAPAATSTDGTADTVAHRPAWGEQASP